MITGETASQKDQRNCPEVSGKVSVHVTLEKELLLLSICSIVFGYLWPQGLQHAKLPCPSPTPRACSNSCPSRQWRHPTISSSVVPFSSCLQSFTASGSFPMSQFFITGAQSIGASASVLPMSILYCFPLRLTGLIALQSRECQESSPTLQLKSINFLVLKFLYGPTLTSIHDYWKNDILD